MRNLFPRLHKARQNEAGLSAALIEANSRNHKLTGQVLVYRGALHEVVSTARAVNTPNGTTRKILRIAENAL